MLRVRVHNKLPVFVLYAVFVDEPQVRNRVQMPELGCFLVVLYGASDLGLPIGVFPLELLLGVDESLLKELAYPMHGLCRVKFLGLSVVPQRPLHVFRQMLAGLVYHAQSIAG